MVKYITTSLFESPAQSIVNTVNIVGAMGKGIAKEFKRIYPDMFSQYRELCDKGELDIGRLHIYRTNNKIIINFPTKKHWRSPSKLEYVESGLGAFVKGFVEYGISSVSFPQLGTGNGELDWESQVRPVMEKYLKGLPIPVYIHMYPKSPHFIPERLDRRAARQYMKDLYLERERLSPLEVWEDIKSVIKSKYEMRLFKKLTVTIDRGIEGEKLVFERIGGVGYEIYKDEFVELWNVLRLNGTVDIYDVPSDYGKEDFANTLFDLLEELDYIKNVELLGTDSITPVRGLMHQPRPIEYEESIEDATIK